MPTAPRPPFAALLFVVTSLATAGCSTDAPPQAASSSAEAAAASTLDPAKLETRAKKALESMQRQPKADARGRMAVFFLANDGYGLPRLLADVARDKGDHEKRSKAALAALDAPPLVEAVQASCNAAPRAIVDGWAASPTREAQVRYVLDTCHFDPPVDDASIGALDPVGALLTGAITKVFRDRGASASELELARGGAALFVDDAPAR